MPVLAKLAMVAMESFSIDRIDTTSLATACLARLLVLGLFAGNSKTSDLSLNYWFRGGALGRALSAQTDQSLPPALWISRLLKYRAASHPLQWQFLWTALHDREEPEECAALFSSAARGQELPEEPKQLPLWPVMSIRGTLLPARSALRDTLAVSHSLSVAADRLAIEPVHLLKRLLQEPDLLVNWRKRVAALRTRAAIECIHATASKQALLDWSAIQSACSVHVNWLRHRSPASLEKILHALAAAEATQQTLL